MKKLLLVLLTVLFFIYFPDFKSEPHEKEKSVPEPAPVDVKVMSYDFSNAEKEGVRDVERMAEEIEEAGADVIRVRKLESSEPTDFQRQTTMLAERLGMSYISREQLASQTATGDSDSGRNDTAILSKHPIIDAVNHTAPHTDNSTMKDDLIEAIINVNGIQVRLFDTQQTKNQTQQMNEIKKFAADSEGPSIVMGDLDQSGYGSENELAGNDLANVKEMETYTYSLSDPENRMDYFFTDRNRGESFSSGNLLLTSTLD
ncbi:endonuclease/exonuclease/phosphatase family protein [Thalassobacillus devorans]|uniref:endonuclease/exonuclease/phosphatase family protein n=1 Tax=Thalassobacillus devorans TaxID=279813 RepID=UPI000A1C9030|nr:endonuclease/exonuclease/phosphatase family protein [Thalassobacillus devorans]